MVALRRVDRVADLDALFAIARDCESAVVEDPDTSRADIEGLFASPEADLVDGCRVAVDAAGAALGFVAVHVDLVGHEVSADAYVSPALDDSVWDLLLGHARAYASARVASLDPEDAAGWVLAAGSYAQDERYAAALERLGLVVVRRFHTMAITFDPADPPTTPSPPIGVMVSVAGDDEGAQRAAHAVANKSFKGHWRHVDRPYDAFMSSARSQAFDPSQWWLATVDGEVAGVSLGNEHLAELGWGYVGTLGVLAAHRGRGIARLLLETAFAEAYVRGRVGVKLGVDAQNQTGAPALYAAVGMRPSQTIDFWQRPITS